MHVYCLFCETQHCRQIATIIEKDFGFRCIYPQIVQCKWIKGKPTEEMHDWLPGYIFLYTEQSILTMPRVSGIIRCLGNGELSGKDLEFAWMIQQREGIIGNVSLIRKGSRCKIKDTAWSGLQGEVIKMDRERKRCCIRFVFDDTVRTIWVGYEIVDTE